jgi:SAM-dependent methyltransferase
MQEADAPGRAKARFDDIYDSPDPRAYFRTLGTLDYEIPQLAQPAVQAVISSLRREAGQATTTPLRVLDVCCSYGINAALLRTDVTLDQLYDRYSSPAVAELTPTELAEQDRTFFADRRTASTWVAGLDIARNAIDYAGRVGLLDRGWAEDLEAADPSRSLADELSRVDLIITTGGVGYITERTFDRLLRPQRAGRGPWVLAMVLRLFPYDDIAATLASHGLTTEKLEGVTFAQRRFASAAEQDAALRDVLARGLDATGLEADGRYHAELYLSRPDADLGRPLHEVLSRSAAGGSSQGDEAPEAPGHVVGQARA